MMYHSSIRIYCCGCSIHGLGVSPLTWCVIRSSAASISAIDFGSGILTFMCQLSGVNFWQDREEEHVDVDNQGCW